MQPTTPPPSSSTALRRYGPIIAIVVVVVLVAVLVIVNHGSSSTNTAATTSTTEAGGFHPAGVTSWSEAKAEGKTSSIDWGSRCDTTKGTLKYPSFFAGECYAPFHGDNGGATAPGITATTVKVVLYQAQENDPILKYIEGSIADTDTNKQTAETVRDWITFYQTYYETYGRKLDLVTYTATGNVSDEVAARADATQIAETDKPFAVIGGPILTAAFGNQLAADHIICIDCMPGQPNNFYPAHSPYVFGLAMNPDEAQVHDAAFIGARAAGAQGAVRGRGRPQGQDPQVRRDLHLHRPGRRDPAEALRGEPGHLRRAPRPGAGLHRSDQAPDRRARPHRQAQGGRRHVGDLLG